MADKLVGSESLGQQTITEVTTTKQGTKNGLDVSPLTPGTGVNPLAKYVEAEYTNDNKTVIFRYYESSSKATLYNTITSTYSTPQDTCFISAEWT